MAISTNTKKEGKCEEATRIWAGVGILVMRGELGVGVQGTSISLDVMSSFPP